MTKENAHLFLPLIQALADGKNVEYNAGTSRLPDWNELKNYSWNRDLESYRIKPDPVMVPLGPEDVPPGSVIRQTEGVWETVLYVGQMGILNSKNDLLYWSDLKGFGYEIKRPGEDWTACSKPA